MLKGIQERKHCNRLVIILWRNTITFEELIWDHFGVNVKRNGDHFGVGIILGSILIGLISGLGIISGAVHISCES